MTDRPTPAAIAAALRVLRESTAELEDRSERAAQLARDHHRLPAAPSWKRKADRCAAEAANLRSAIAWVEGMRDE